MTQAKPLRADAVRNRARVLDAARQAFAEQGLAVPIDDIARAAGVGAGTVYRHFPTKESLYEAILLEHVDMLVREARTLAAGDQPGPAFFAFLTGFGTRGTGNRALAEALTSAGVDVDGRLAASKRQLVAAVSELLASAQQAGAVRSDIGIAELFGLLSGVHAAVDQAGDPGMTGRLLAVIGDGLRAPA